MLSPYSPFLPMVRLVGLFALVLVFARVNLCRATLYANRTPWAHHLTLPLTEAETWRLPATLVVEETRTAHVWSVRFQGNAGQIGLAWPYPWKDVVLQAEICMDGPDQDALWAGFFCRAEGWNQGYLFVLTGDGYAGVARMEKGQPLLEETSLTYKAPWPETPPCRRVQATCQATRLTLTVDNQPWAVLQDAHYPLGRGGFWAALSQPGHGEVQFRGVEVWVP